VASKDDVTAEMARLIAAITGVSEQDAAKTAAELVDDAAAQVPGAEQQKPPARP